MEDTRKELESMEKVLFREETVSLDELLNDRELQELLGEKPAEKPAEQLVYQNFANGYGAGVQPQTPAAPQRSKRDDRIIVALMSTASVLCLDIIGVLAYWLTVLL